MWSALNLHVIKRGTYTRPTHTDTPTNQLTNTPTRQHATRSTRQHTSTNAVAQTLTKAHDQMNIYTCTHTRAHTHAQPYTQPPNVALIYMPGNMAKYMQNEECKNALLATVSERD